MIGEGQDTKKTHIANLCAFFCTAMKAQKLRLIVAILLTYSLNLYFNVLKYNITDSMS